MASGLDIWITKPEAACRIDTRTWRVTIYDTHGNVLQFAGILYADVKADYAHTAVSVPPGRYVVQAKFPGLRTDRAIVTVGTDEVVGVLLFVSTKGPVSPPQCEIAIDEVYGLRHGSGTSPDEIVVAGNAFGCQEIVVTIHCDNHNFRQTTNVADDGSWTATIRAPRCHCDRPLSVTAECSHDPNCRTTLAVPSLECRGAPGPVVH
ncbi:hypothetical protein OG889_44910 [Streptomyces sp. NBC_00481]|uniref:hypothetical protein n=1 Tax=Streptomyces sp. NBC_00481 TaxID=2975755 RepID=UPI002DDB7C6F|nr:hypothetical protein [Streptomyces sp. NBC_00481]WRZ01196.1 hypothetical protein OG889_44910 [Streptomyces sp. NBC_00481]